MTAPRSLVHWCDDDGRVRVAVVIGDGNKWRHLLAMSASGMRIVDVPLDAPLDVAGEFKPRSHLAAFKRFAKTFGSTQPARAAIKLLEEESKQ